MGFDFEMLGQCIFNTPILFYHLTVYFLVR